VTLVGRPEKAYFGLTDKVHILGTDSNKLGNTTRHFILYGDFIFKLGRLTNWGTIWKKWWEKGTINFVDWNDGLIQYRYMFS